VPAVAEDSAVVAIARADGATVMEAGTDVVCTGFPSSDTETVKLNVPVTVGVPEMTPVIATRVRPEGRLPPEIDQV